MRLLTSAAIAGLGSGLLAAALQIWFLQPVLILAEMHESGAAGNMAGAIEGGAHGHGHDGQDHGHGDGRADAEYGAAARAGLVFAFSALIYTGYALVLAACMSLAALRGAALDARTGAIWGVAGFAVFQMAPAFSMPPETPGMAGADVDLSQIWWWSTAAATALGLGLLAFGTGWVKRIAGAALILAPHVAGAPQPDGHAGAVPPEVAGLFVSRALGVSLIAWTAMGALAGRFLRE